MDKTQIGTVLNRLFYEQGKQIVFWNDPRSIALDMDDGVKVNCGKFGDLPAEVKAITAGGED